jgi:glycine cleavage system aminomethyltransferase T
VVCTPWLNERGGIEPGDGEAVTDLGRRRIAPLERHARVLALRVTCVGELGWELHVPRS